MALVIGIDEAGYGPLLGPLSVSATAFRVPDGEANACLWALLADSCTRRVAKTDHRLPITDSKKLHKPGQGFAPLERTALVMLAVRDDRPATWRQLLELISPSVIGDLSGSPWYNGVDFDLPCLIEPDSVGTRANAVRRDVVKSSVTFLGVRTEILTAHQYNLRVERTHNKSIVLIGLVSRLMDRIIRKSKDRLIRIYIDRLGGRTHYREHLMNAWPELELTILAEDSKESSYRMTGSSHIIEVSFVKKGDATHLPIALASIYSKYVRELFMRAFNEYWCAQMPGLKPTAGYYSDGVRWLKDAADAIESAGVDRKVLVRER